MMVTGSIKNGRWFANLPKAKGWLPTFLYAGLIFFMSSIPSDELPGLGLDMSLLHIAEFFILSYLIYRAFTKEKMDIRYAFLLAIVISTLYGVTDELHQLFVPGRQFSFFDMTFNFIGSSLILFKLWRN